MQYKKITGKLPQVAIGLISAFIFPIAAIGQASADPPKPGVCQDVQLTVAVAQGQPADQTVSGTYCTPLFWQNEQQRIDVLVHGATYNSNYWDYPYNNTVYSYVNDTLLAGRATFAYDDVGTGQSSHPSSNDLTYLGDAYILHQVVSWVQGQGYSKIDVIAHSKGSAVAIAEAAQYQDISALVVTGLLHQITTFGTQGSQTDFHPAFQDPLFLQDPLLTKAGTDPGYLTTVPNVRGQLFYSAAADPGLIAYDEAHKDVFAVNEFAQSFPYVFAPAAGNISNSITIPVLSVVGQQDKLFCGSASDGVDCSSAATVKAEEAPFYPNAADYDAQVIPATGHDLALHPTNKLTFTGINTWIQSH